MICTSIAQKLNENLTQRWSYIEAKLLKTYSQSLDENRKPLPYEHIWEKFKSKNSLGIKEDWEKGDNCILGILSVFVFLLKNKIGKKLSKIHSLLII